MHFFIFEQIFKLENVRHEIIMAHEKFGKKVSA